jgi:hypothetical protein
MRPNLVLLGVIFAAGCGFTIHHDGIVDTASLSPPFAVLPDAVGVEAKRFSNGYEHLNYSLEGKPADVWAEVKRAVIAPGWESVQKEATDKWFMVETPREEYVVFAAWIHSDGKVFSLRVEADPPFSDLRLVRVHMTLYPAEDATRYLDGLDAHGELIKEMKDGVLPFLW